jgi:hypothetical protein
MAPSSANEDDHPEQFDFSQQSESNSPKTRSQNRQTEEEGDLVKDFSFWKEGDSEGTALNYCCKWCKKVY